MGINSHMSIIRPHLKLPAGRILIALLAAIIVAALVPAASSAERSITHRLVFRLSGPERQDVIGAPAILGMAHCPTDACTVVASATSESPSFRTAKVHAHVRAGASERIALPLTSRQRGKLKAALEAGNSPTITVRATAHDAAGDRVLLSLAVRPVKP
jgi:hypothetical protein